MQTQLATHPQPLPDTPPKALIVNDSVLERVALSKLCVAQGFQVIEASGQDNILDLIERERADLLVCDFDLIDQDGLEVCSGVRQAKFDFYVYIILLSNKTEESFSIRALQAGVDEHFGKPLSKSEVQIRMAVAARAIEFQKRFYTEEGRLPDDLTALTRDMRALTQFQASQLPKRGSEIEGIAIEYFWIPKLFVSGDLFNVLQLNDQWLSFYMFDVVGHGVPAALKAMELSRLLSLHPQEGLLLEFDSSRYSSRIRFPAELLTLLNNRFQMRDAADLYFCMAYGLFNLHTGEVTLALAGSPPALYQDLEGELRELGSSSFPIGVTEDGQYTDVTMKFDAGMRLFLHTDGLTQIRDLKDQALEPEGARGLILAHQSEALEQQVLAIKGGLDHWVSGKKSDRLYEDDVTLLALQWRSKGSDDLIEPEFDPQQNDETGSEPEDQNTLRETMENADAEPVFTFPVRRENSKVVLWTDAQGLPDLSGWLLAWGYQVVRCPAELQGPQSGSPVKSPSVIDTVIDSVLEALKSSYCAFLLIDLQDLSAVTPDFLHRVRSEGKNPSLYILLMSNPANANQTIQVLAAGADSCTQAHYSPNEIYTRLVSGLRQANIFQKLTEQSQSASALKEDIQEDMHRIAEMQLANLPKQKDEHAPVLLDVLFKPAQLVSRHYMNVMHLPDGHLAFFHLSADGVGLVGAARGLALYRQLTHAAYDRTSSLSRYMSDQFSPAAILRELNAQLIQDPSNKENCALCYGVVNPQTGDARISHAGYPLCAVTHASGGFEYLGAYGAALGLSVESQYQDVFFTLHPGDRLFVFPESLNIHPAFNGQFVDNAEKLFKKTIDMEFSAIIPKLHKVFDGYTEADYPDDLQPVDVSMLTFQVGEYQPLVLIELDLTQQQGLLTELSALMEGVETSFEKAFLIEIPLQSRAVAEVVQEVSNRLQVMQISEDRTGSIQLVLFELLSNVCRHSGLDSKAHFTLYAFVKNGTVFVVVVDTGIEIPASVISAASGHDYEFDVNVEEDIPSGGLGLPLIHSLSSRFEYARSGQKNYTALWFEDDQA